MKILNLTQHAGTVEQTEAGLIEPADKQAVKALLNVGVGDHAKELGRKARKLAEVAIRAGARVVLVGGQPALMRHLCHHLELAGIDAVEAFTERVVVEESGPDGTTVKKSVFRHVEWRDTSGDVFTPPRDNGDEREFVTCARCGQESDFRLWEGVGDDSDVGWERWAGPCGCVINHWELEVV